MIRIVQSVRIFVLTKYHIWKTTECSNAVNARYTFQPLWVSVCIQIVNGPRYSEDYFGEIALSQRQNRFQSYVLTSLKFS